MRPLALLLALQQLAAAPVDPALARRVERRVIRALARSQAIPAGWPRAKAVSEALLGVPYGSSPLGEGEGVDPDPRFRFDRVDCVTFVETVLALGNARTEAEAKRLLDDLRYESGAPPTFAHRLHVMEAQWIPGQIAKGYVTDVTRAVGGVSVVEITSTYDRARWKARHGLPELSWADAPHGTFTLPMLPLEHAVRLADDLPDGLVLSVIREQRGRDLSAITHTGLVVVKDGKRFLRHATQSTGSVRDEPLAAFLERHARMKGRRVIGVNLLAVQDNSARAGALAAGE